MKSVKPKGGKKSPPSNKKSEKSQPVSPPSQQVKVELLPDLAHIPRDMQPQKNEHPDLYVERLKPWIIMRIVGIGNDPNIPPQVQLASFKVLLDYADRASRGAIPITPSDTMADKTDEQVAEAIVQDEPVIAELIATQWIAAHPDWQP